MAETRSYNSPLREEKARETREAILHALYRLMSTSAVPDEISMDAIAPITISPIRRRSLPAPSAAPRRVRARRRGSP